MGRVGMWEILASWVGAIGSAGALIAAVWLWRLDRAREHREEARKEKEHLRRLITGLRAEIVAAIEASKHQQEGVDGALAAAEQARKSGGVIVDRGPVRPGSMAITDAIIYCEVASELGRLPPEIIRHVVGFYARAREIGRFVEAAASAVSAYATVRDLAPRIRMGGAMCINALDKFERSGFSPDADLKPTLDEMREMAKQTGYPLDAIARDRGFKV